MTWSVFSILAKNERKNALKTTRIEFSPLHFFAFLFLYLEEDQIRVIHHGQLPEGLLELGTGEAGSRSCSLLGNGLGGLAAAEPARLLLGGGGLLGVAGLALEGGRGGLVELGLAVKDVVKADPELLELLSLLGGQVAEAALSGGNGLNVGGHDCCVVGWLVR